MSRLVKVGQTVTAAIGHERVTGVSVVDLDHALGQGAIISLSCGRWAWGYQL